MLKPNIWHTASVQDLSQRYLCCYVCCTLQQSSFQGLLVFSKDFLFLLFLREEENRGVWLGTALALSSCLCWPMIRQSFSFSLVASCFFLFLVVSPDRKSRQAFTTPIYNLNQPISNSRHMPLAGNKNCFFVSFFLVGMASSRVYGSRLGYYHTCSMGTP